MASWVFFNVPEDSVILVTDTYGSTINQAMGQVLPPCTNLWFWYHLDGLNKVSAFQ